jgi:hypothetical protein
MKREQMIEKVWHLLNLDGLEELHCDHLAAAILDAVLPQVSTVAELRALPGRCLLVGKAPSGVDPHVYDWFGSELYDLHSRCYRNAQSLLALGPLTVVWRP